MKKMKLFRKDSLHHYGFGLKEMMSLTVCEGCQSLESSKKTHCSVCGLRLSKANLYDLYKSYHKKCTKCGAVLSATMHYCTHCGNMVNSIDEFGAPQIT